MAIDQKETIISAAQKRFAQYGYSKVKMEEIAADICISKSALYYHFTDKDAIFREVLLLEQKDFLKRLEHLVTENGSAKELFRKYFRLRLDLTLRLQNLGMLDSLKIKEMRPSLRALYHEFYQKERLLIIRMLTNKEFVIDRIEEITDLIMHVINGMHIRRRALEVPIEDFSKEIILLGEVLLNGIICEPGKE